MGKKRLNDTAALRAPRPMAADALSGRRTKTEEVRPIENGFLHRISESGPDGWKEREVYHKEEPNMREGKAPPPCRSLGSAVRHLKK